MLVMLGMFCPWPGFCQLDTAVRKALDEKLTEYFAAIERAGTDVQKGECDFLIGTCGDSLMRQHVALTAYEHYRDSKVMGSEAVAIHLFDEWIASGKVRMRDDSEMLAAQIFAEFNRRSLIGNKAQELILYDMEGKPEIIFDGPRDRYSVLFFYDSSCSVCRLQSILLRNLFQDEDFPVDFIAVYASDDMDSWREYVQEQLSFDAAHVRTIHLWDPEISSDFQRKYGVIQTPRMFLISPDGVILGRGLDAHALSQLLHAVFDEPELEYGSDGAMDLYDGIFGDVPASQEDVDAVADHIQASTLEKGDTLMYRQMTGDFMYYLAHKKGEGFKEGLYGLVSDKILSRPDVWKSEDDSLKVVGMALMYEDLLSKNRKGARISDLKLPGVMLSKGKEKTGAFRLRKLGGERNFIMFVTDGCHVCAAEKAAAREAAASDRKAKVLMVNVDDVLASDPSLASRLFGSFDLSTLPFILQTDRKGVVTRRYVSFL